MQGVAQLGEVGGAGEESDGRLELMLKVLDVDGAVRRVKGGWIATGLQWTYDAERYARSYADAIAAIGRATGRISLASSGRAMPP